MRIVIAISRIHFQVWMGGVARALGSRRATRSMLTLSFILLTTWIVFGTARLSSVKLDFTTGDYSLIHPLAVMLFGFPAMMTVFIAMYSVSDSLVENMLVVLPVRSRDRRIATDWMATILSTGLSMALMAPLIIRTARSFTVGTGLTIATCCVLITLIGGVAAVVLYASLQVAFVAVIGDGQTAKVLAGSASSMLTAWLMIMALPRLDDPYGAGPLAVASAPLRWIVDRSVPSAFAISVCAAPVAGAALVLRLLRSIPPRRLVQPPRFTVRVRPLQARSMLGLELRQWLRFPANATTLLFVQVISLILTFGWGSRWSPEEWAPAAYLLLALASTLSVGSFGATHPHHWIYRVARQPLRWALPKLGSVVILWAFLVAEILLLLCTLTSWNAKGLYELIATCLTVLLAGCVVGIMLPVNRDQTMGGALSASAAIVLVMAISWALQSLPRSGPDGSLSSLLTPISGSAVLVVAYLLLARASVRQDQI